MDISEKSRIISLFIVIIVILLCSGFAAMKEGNAIRTSKQEKYQMMKVLVENGLASYTIDPNTGVASITYLVREKKELKNE